MKKMKNVHCDFEGNNSKEVEEMKGDSYSII